MAENEFKVVLEADSSPLRKALAEATKNTEKFAADFAKIKAPNLGRLGAELEAVQKNLKTATGGSNQLGKAMQSIRPASNQATTAMTNFSRIAQDAAFGPLAIANNIEPAILSLQNLTKAAGGPGGALKALAGSLIGPGGLVFAAGALTFALSGGLPLLREVGDYLSGGLSDAAKQAKERFEGTQKATEEFQKTINSIIDATGKEASKIQLLVAQLENGNLSRQQQVAVIKQLQQVAPDYFGMLDAEKAKISDVALAYGNYSKAILKSVEARIRSAELENIVADRLALTRKLLASGAIKETDGDYGAFSQTLAGIKKIVDDFPDTPIPKLFSQGFNKASGDIQALAGLLRRESEKLKEIGKDINLKDLGVSLSDFNTKPGEDALKKQIELMEKLRNEIGLLKFEEEILADLKIQLVIRDGPQEGLNQDQIQRSINKILQDSAIARGSKIDIPVFVEPQLKITPAESIKGAFSDLTSMIGEQGRLAGIAYGEGIGSSLAAAINTSVGKGVEDAFFGIADSVGRAFAEGENPIIAFGERFMQTIGAVLQEIGKQIIIESKVVAALKAALKATGPGLQTIPLGIALVAAGAAAKSIKFNIPKLAQGGITTGATLAMIGEAGREAVIPLDRLNDFIQPANAPVILNGNWEIAGEKLRFVLEQTNKKRQRR